MGAPVVETEKMHCRHWADGLFLYYCITRYFRIRNSKKACPLPPLRTAADVCYASTRLHMVAVVETEKKNSLESLG